ncbi:DUF1361 domain-containing protein [Mycobacteroides franklinii]|uniref:DUF1361 domain-containing protein n=1 Tax=Mycobacteroides franklinii TaxID=948102 RepID=A0A4R5PCI9_9MYCO|nr:DUF1361 domain-containing protein [Mycobacteroides franklinii]ORA63066.1 hypothetical protein BST24_05395 [Mycobacteroides franklinii]TDH22477.1 DUF1361 domain-containing protein [Mycobacteroides franklinii]
MSNDRLRVVIYALAATSVASVVLGLADPPSPQWLLGNLLRAWIPLALALVFLRVRGERWQWVSGVLWLVFLPNAPYLVADLAYINHGSIVWPHIFQLGMAAWTGIMLAVLSLRLVHERIEKERGTRAGWIVVGVSIVLSAIGVVIGGFQAKNSWDLLTGPGQIIQDTLQWLFAPMTHLIQTQIALSTAVFVGLAYLTLWCWEQKPDGDAPTQ